jgi:hypothetical protein
MSNENSANERADSDELTPEELQAAGSIEANMWTITPPGGRTMSLDEHEKQRQQRMAATDEDDLPRDTRAMEDIPGTPEWNAKIDAGRGFE